MTSDDTSSLGPSNHGLRKGDLLTVEEAAEITRVTRKTVRSWIREGKLVGLKFGKHWRIRRQDLDSFVEHAITTAQVQKLQSRPETD
jgi:excisionase family DNA binding protein